MIRVAKKGILGYLPDWFLATIKRTLLTPIRHLRRRVLQLRRRHAIAQLTSRTGWKVLAGPFAGLNFVAIQPGGGGPHLLGTFERELSPIVEEILNANYEHLVNVGAGGGYYAVGFLYRLPTARVTAFEELSDRRESVLAFATKNDVSQRLSMRGHCDTAALAGVVREAESTVLLVDIEGGERELLDPAVLPVLRKTPILVEVHDFIDTGISNLIRTRFAPTHSISVIQHKERERRDLPVIPGLSYRVLKLLAFEGRPEKLTWFWMQPLVPCV